MHFFHAHVYFTEDQKSVAQALYSQVAVDFNGSDVKRIGFYPNLVGPHSLPMFELNFLSQHLDALTEWLKCHRSGLSVLIHEDTRNDERDHLENVIWLGTPIKIHFDFFDQIKTRPDLKIHSDF